MALSDVFQATIAMNVQGQEVVNVLHFEQTSGDGPIAPNRDLCLAIEASLIPVYKLCTSEDLTFEAIKAHRVKPSIAGTYVHPISGSGQVTEDTLPPNNSVLATLYTTNLTRAGRGRIFMPGVPDTFQNRGRLVVAGADLYVDFLAALLLPVQAGLGATFQAGVCNPPDGDFHDYTSHELRSRVNTLRSRRMENPV